MFRKSVERWRDLARAELARTGSPLPVNLILAVIHVESRGFPGNTNPKSGASGLMQVMPGTLAGYNKQTGDNITLDQLRSPNHPDKQIRAGVWVVNTYWKSAYKYLNDRLTDVPVQELGKVADLFYVAGPGATKKRLNKVAVPFFHQVAQRFPTWNALPHPRNVWKVLPPDTQWDTAAIGKWLNGTVRKIQKVENTSILLIALMVIGYWWFMKGKGKKDGKEKDR